MTHEKPLQVLSSQPDRENTPEHSENELPPETIEMIMKKVRDINSVWTAYHGIGFLGSPKFLNSTSGDNDLLALKSVLNSGLLAFPYGNDDALNANNAQEMANIWAKNYKGNRKKHRPLLINFNVMGKCVYSHLSSPREVVSRMGDPRNFGTCPPEKKIAENFPNMASQDGLVILFDLEHLLKNNQVHNMHTGKTTEIGDDPQEYPETTDGYFTKERIAPRFLQGVVFKLKRNMNEAELKQGLEAMLGEKYSEEEIKKLKNFIALVIKFFQAINDHTIDGHSYLKEKQKLMENWLDDTTQNNLHDRDKLRKACEIIWDNCYEFFVYDEDPQRNAEHAQKLAQVVLETSQQTNQDRLLPIYDIKGNLYWPKQMTHEEVMRFVEERDKEKEKS
ncbi:MAG: hypothetical protein WCV69_00545 [Patescibacteria group bacterium]|jgi:hypothetical protein